jgi:LytS/YehU family sensor histidine kinase
MGFSAAMMGAQRLVPLDSWIPGFNWFWLGMGCFWIVVTVHGAGRATMRVRGWASERAADAARARLALTQAEFDGLQSRLNPAPLFATLDAIGSLSGTDPAGAERLVERLSTFLRASLDRARRSFSSISDEQQFVEAFLALTEQDPLPVDWRIDPATREFLVPANCLLHAVEWARELTRSPRQSVSITSSLATGGTELQILVEVRGSNSTDVSSLPPSLATLAVRLDDRWRGGGSLTTESSGVGLAIRLRLPAAQHLDWDRLAEGAR